MELHSSPKIYKGYKCENPEKIIKKIQEGFKKIGLELSYFEKKTQSNNLTYIDALVKIKGLGGIAEGGSFSSISAKASAYAEMAERFSSKEIAFYAFPSVKNIPVYNSILKNVMEMKFLKGLIRLDRENIVPHNKVNNFFKQDISKKQYEIIKEQRFLEIECDAYSFTDERYRKIPIVLTEIMSASNGVASGTTKEEALVNATCEIFERYVALEVVTKKIVCQTINKDSINDEEIQKFISFFDSLNIEVIFKDLRIKDLPIVGVFFINHNFDDDSNQLKKHYCHKKLIVASHPDLKEAIKGCFSEYIQLESSEDNLKFGKKADILYDFWTKRMGKSYNGPSTKFSYFFHYYNYFKDLSFLEKGNVVSFEELKSIHFDDCLDDFTYLLDKCKKNNWDLLAVDYTHKLLKFPTIRVIIPPISTDFNPDVRETLNFSDFKERFNFFYEIKDFYDYYHDDSWINDKKRIMILIENLEEFLSKNLFYYHIMIYIGIFHQFLNVFHVLAFAYLSLGREREALEYLKVIYELENDPSFHNEYSDIIFNYQPNSLSAWISLLERENLKNNSEQEKLLFTFNSNPLKREGIGFDHSECLFRSQLKNINNSFK